MDGPRSRSATPIPRNKQPVILRGKSNKLSLSDETNNLSSCTEKQTNCHPERSLARFLRQTQSKDLRLFYNEFLTHHTSRAPVP
jgi:hypothetical protein